MFLVGLWLLVVFGFWLCVANSFKVASVGVGVKFVFFMLVCFVWLRLWFVFEFVFGV